MSPHTETAAGWRRFVQICASRNDLFALGENGSIHQYNFTVQAWEALVAARAPDGSKRGERGRRRWTR